jgi:muconate cycloisomerase
VLPSVTRLLSPSPGNQTCCCAAELALLDLAGKAFDRSAAAWFGGRRRESVRYSVVLPLLEPAETTAFLAMVKRLGVAHLKIKAEGDRWPDALAEARTALGDGVTLTVDANGSWDLDAAVRHLDAMKRYRVAWVEQPLPRGREDEIPLLAGRSAIPLMADESLTTVEEAMQLVRQRGYRLFNLRLSKLGGLGTTQRIARIAADNGVRLQVGCQVGESSLLSAAGRLLAATLPGIEALEGSYGSRLLESDVADEPYEFGQGGFAEVQRTPGLGIRVSPERLARLVINSAAVNG